MNLQIGTAPDSWGVWFPDDPRQTPWHRFLDEVVEAGYEWIELGPYGYLPTDFATLQNELQDRGLKVSGTFIMHDLSDKTLWPTIEEDVHKTGEILEKLGAKYLVVIDNIYTNLFTGESIAPAQLDKSGWKQLIETTQQIADWADDHCLTVVYHPHANTHVETKEQIEALLDQTDPERVSLCLETGHQAYCGHDPVAFMRKHHKRVPYMHLKSVDVEMQRRVEEEGIPFAKAVELDMFCEPSKGMVDFIAFRDLLEELDFSGWGIVEQDMYPAPFDKPLPIAKRTRSYLREIGLG